MEKRRQGISGWTKDGKVSFIDFSKNNANTALRDQNFYQNFIIQTWNSDEQDELIYERPDNKEYFVAAAY